MFSRLKANFARQASGYICFQIIVIVIRYRRGCCRQHIPINSSDSLSSVSHRNLILHSRPRYLSFEVCTAHSRTFLWKYQGMLFTAFLRLKPCKLPAMLQGHRAVGDFWFQYISFDPFQYTAHGQSGNLFSVQWLRDLFLQGQHLLSDLVNQYLQQ